VPVNFDFYQEYLLRWDNETASKTTGDCFLIVIFSGPENISFEWPKNCFGVALICFSMKQI
jgi:hypothetical protein